MITKKKKQKTKQNPVTKIWFCNPTLSEEENTGILLEFQIQVFPVSQAGPHVFK